MSTIEAMPFDKVYECIRSDIFKNPCAVFLSEQRNMLVTYMNMSKDVTITQSTKKTFLPNLTEFKNSIELISDSSRRVILYPHNLSMDKPLCDIRFEKGLQIICGPNIQTKTSVNGKTMLYFLEKTGSAQRGGS